MAKILTFEDIVSANDTAELTVEIPAWGGAVKVRKLSVEEALALRDTFQADGDDQFVSLVAACVSEPQMTRDQARSLLKKSVAAFSLIVRAINELNGFSEGFGANAEATFRGGNGSAAALRSG